jgi:hypothetical protein
LQNILDKVNNKVYTLIMRTETNKNYPQAEQKMVSIFIRDIPREVRDSFKALCVIRGITMRQALVEMMLKALEGSPIPVPNISEEWRSSGPEK